MGILIKQNSKVISSYSMLRVRTFRASSKSLRVRYAQGYERACNFFRPDVQ